MIPKIIYITHESYKDLFKYENCIKHTLYYNPTYKIEFYDKNRRENFIKNNFPEFYYFYKQINSNYGAMKADIFRILILYKYGGIYIDCKTRLNNIDEVFYKYPDKDFYTISYREELFYHIINVLYDSKYTNYFIATKPYGDIITKIKNKVYDNLLSYPNIKNELNSITYLFCQLPFLKNMGNKEKGLLAVFNMSGPIVFTKIINKNKDKVIDISKMDKQYVIYNSNIPMNKRFIKGSDYVNSYHFTEQQIFNN
jgi:mannosyltransferase OCH1-like enzyme